MRRLVDRKAQQQKRVRMACKVACPQCGAVVGKRCPVASGYHAARSDLAFQQRKTKGQL